jgi:hypothetical protein
MDNNLTRSSTVDTAQLDLIDQSSVATLRSPQIFNHDIMHCTHDEVVGNYLYSGRVLGSTEPDDLIQLHPDLKSQWPAITAHYDRVGLTYSHHPIWDLSFDHLRRHPEYGVSVFIFGDALHGDDDDAHWFRDRNRKWQDTVEYINSKNDFIDLANRLQIPVPTTLCFEDKGELNVQGNSSIPYPCYFKPAISVDGAGIYRCEDEPALQIALDKLPGGISFQIQQEVIASTFLNLQYYVFEGQALPYGATEQILRGFAHNGNRYPTPHQPWAMIQPMADWLLKEGMKGIFAFDVAVVPTENGGFEYYAIECNPRFNGASYPTGIAKKLKLPSWAGENFDTVYRSLDQIDLSGLEFDRDRGTGAIIVNWGSILVGKLSILMAGTIAQQEALRQALNIRLGNTKYSN